MMLKTSKIHGFTLMELMITIALVAIIIGLAIPNMGPFIKKRALRSTFDELHLSLVYARSEAVKQRKKIYVVPATDGWGQGWCVTSSKNINCASESEFLLRTFTAHGKNLDFTNFPTSPGITFNGKGSHGYRLDNLGVADPSINVKFCLEVSATGRTASIPCS